MLKTTMALGLVIVAAGCKPSAKGPQLPFRIAPETTGIVSPLRADGTPDYAGAINDATSIGVTPENNGYLPFLKAVGTDGIELQIRKEYLQLCGASEFAGKEAQWEPFAEYVMRKHKTQADRDFNLENELYELTRQPWKASEHPVTAGYVAENESRLALITEAMARPNFWMPTLPKALDSPFSARWGLKPAREVVNVMTARATLRAGSGDLDGFCNDALAAKAIGPRVARGPFTVEFLGGIAIDEVAIRAIGSVAGRGVLSAEQCRRLVAWRAGGCMPSSFADQNETERWIWLDLVITAATDPGRLPASSSDAWREIDRSRVDWNFVLMRVQSVMSELQLAPKEVDTKDLVTREKEEFEQASDFFLPMFSQVMSGQKVEPLQTGTLVPAADETREVYTLRVADNFLAMQRSMGVHYAMEKRHRDALLREEALDALLAVALLKAEGRQIGRVEDLPLEARRMFVADPYADDGVLLRLRQTPQGFRVYSVGNNGVDDGGVFDRSKKQDDIVVGVADEATR